MCYQYCELMRVTTSYPPLCAGLANIGIPSVQEDTFSLRHRLRPQESNSSPLHPHVWDMPTLYSLYRTMLAQINTVAILMEQTLKLIQRTSTTKNKKPIQYTQQSTYQDSVLMDIYLTHNTQPHTKHTRTEHATQGTVMTYVTCTQYTMVSTELLVWLAIDRPT